MQSKATLHQLHGVMMQVNDIGVLIVGEPGIGKSSLALELLHHGHQLIADDVVDYQIAESSITTSSPTILFGLLHLRELGIIDVKQQFGKNAVLTQSSLLYVVELAKHLNVPSDINGPSSQYKIEHLSLPLLRLDINNPASCYHRLISWLKTQQQPNGAADLIARQRQALVNKHS